MYGVRIAISTRIKLVYYVLKVYLRIKSTGIKHERICEMSFEALKEEIDKGIKESLNNTEISRFRHHKTAFNKLVQICDLTDKNIYGILFHDLDNTIERCKKWYLDENKDSKSLLKRVRRLSEFYIQKVCPPIPEGKTFHEILKIAFERKFEKTLYKDVIPQNKSKEILKTHHSYFTGCKEIIIAGCIENPQTWEKVDLNINVTVLSSARLLQDYVLGRSIPGARVPDCRILFIEKFLDLPKYTLLNLLPRKIDYHYKGRDRTELDSAVKDRVSIKHNKLNCNLQKVYDDYSNYKINNVDPTLTNIPSIIEESEYKSILSSISEIKKDKQKWTLNAVGKCPAQSGFFNELLKFQDICIKDFNIKYEDVSTYHLTDPFLLKKMCVDASVRKAGGSTIARIMNFIKRAIQYRGYLYFCADLGDRSLNRFWMDLEFISEHYVQWSDLAKSGVTKRAKASQKGKQNIQFLLELTNKERRKAIDDAANYLINIAELYQLESKQKLACAKSARTKKAADYFLVSAGHKSMKAFRYMMIALILKLMYVNIPRCLNWTMLKFYKSSKDMNNSYSSFVYHRQKEQYQLFIPCYGTSLIDPNVVERYLKNAKGLMTVDINIYYPKKFTPIINKFIELRSEYIKNDIEYNIDKGKVDKTLIEPDMLYVHRRCVERENNDPIVSILKDKLIADPGTLGDSFECLTYKAFLNTMPHVKQHGINFHSSRHIVAIDHLEQFPGDFMGAAAKLNDEQQQIIDTYGDQDRAKAMIRVAALEG